MAQCLAPRNNLIVAITWVVIIKMLLGRHLEWHSQVFSLVLGSLKFSLQMEKKKDSILFSYEAFCTCPFLSQWYLALGHTSKPFSGLGVLEGLTCCCCCSSLLIPLPCFLPPELCVWPSWRRAHARTSLPWHRPGHLDFLQHYQPRCAG